MSLLFSNLLSDLTSLAGQHDLQRHGYAAVAFLHHATRKDELAVPVYMLRFSVIDASVNPSPASASATITAFVPPALHTFLGHPAAATIFPIKPALSCSSMSCRALVTR